MVLSMERWKGKVAIVTGAGGGIGGAVVKQLLEQGLKVVAIDRRPDSLESLSSNLSSQKNRLYTFAVDVTQEEEAENLFQKITDGIGPVHVLINCAGILQDTSLVDGDTEKWKRVVDVNVIGLSIMTREAVKLMRENQIDGHIIHFCSYYGHIVATVPNFNLYSASKYAVRALTETLRQELNYLKLKIKISAVSPGYVDTSIFKNNDFRAEGAESWPALKPEDVADAIVYILSTPPHVQVHDLMVKPLGEPF